MEVWRNPEREEQALTRGSETGLAVGTMGPRGQLAWALLPAQRQALHGFRPLGPASTFQEGPLPAEEEEARRPGCSGRPPWCPGWHGSAPEAGPPPQGARTLPRPCLYLLAAFCGLKPAFRGIASGVGGQGKGRGDLPGPLASPRGVARSPLTTQLCHRVREVQLVLQEAFLQVESRGDWPGVTSPENRSGRDRFCPSGPGT